MCAYRPAPSVCVFRSPSHHCKARSEASAPSSQTARSAWRKAASSIPPRRAAGRRTRSQTSGASAAAQLGEASNPSERIAPNRSAKRCRSARQREVQKPQVSGGALVPLPPWAKELAPQSETLPCTPAKTRNPTQKRIPPSQQEKKPAAESSDKAEDSARRLDKTIRACCRCNRLRIRYE